MVKKPTKKTTKKPTKRKPAKTRGKHSINAEAVGKEVIEMVGKGKKVILGEILRRHGYSDSVSKFPQKVTQTKSYKNVVKPYVERLRILRERALAQIEERDLGEEAIGELRNIMKDFTLSIELLEGRPTERVEQTLGQDEKKILDDILGDN